MRNKTHGSLAQKTKRVWITSHNSSLKTLAFNFTQLIGLDSSRPAGAGLFSEKSRSFGNWSRSFTKRGRSFEVMSRSCSQTGRT